MVDLLLKQWISEILNYDIQRIFVGLNNNIIAPKNDPFIILQFLNSSKLQTAFYEVNTDNINELIASQYQIDFYRDKQSALNFYLSISSYLYPSWGNFINFGPPKNLTAVDSTDKYLQRYSLDVTISHTINLNIPQERFDSVIIDPIYIP